MHRIGRTRSDFVHARSGRSAPGGEILGDGGETAEHAAISARAAFLYLAAWMDISAAALAPTRKWFVA